MVRDRLLANIANGPYKILAIVTNIDAGNPGLHIEYFGARYQTGADSAGACGIDDRAGSIAGRPACWRYH